MSTDFWSRRLPPDSETFATELQIRVGDAIDKGLTDEQRREFTRIIDAGGDGDYDSLPPADDDVRLIDRVLYDKYPDGYWQEDNAFRNLVDNQGYPPGSFELKKELAIVFWLERNRPDYKRVVADKRAALYAEFGHGRVYFHPDLSAKLREAVTGGDAERIRSAFVKQKPCPLTVALGNRFLSRDALLRITGKIEALALPPGGKSRPEKSALNSLLGVFDDEARRLSSRAPAAADIGDYKEGAGDKRFAEAITELLGDEALVLFTRSILEADAKELFFADDEDKSRLLLCFDRSKAALKRAYDGAEETYAEAIAEVISDIESTVNISYSLALKSGREGRKAGGV